MSFVFWKEDLKIYLSKQQKFDKNNRKDSEKRILKMIDEKFEILFNDLKREDNLKNDCMDKMNVEIETGMNNMFIQLKNLDSENKQSIWDFGESFKKEASVIFDAIKKEGSSIETNEPKIQALVKEVVDRAHVD